MTWNHQWAGREKFYEHLVATGRLADKHRRPDTWPQYIWLLRAFRELSTGRSQGMSLGQIPLRDILDYADRFGLPMWSVDVLMHVDVHWLKLVNKDG